MKYLLTLLLVFFFTFIFVIAVTSKDKLVFLSLFFFGSCCHFPKISRHVNDYTKGGTEYIRLLKFLHKFECGALRDFKEFIFIDDNSIDRCLVYDHDILYPNNWAKVCNTRFIQKLALHIDRK